MKKLIASLLFISSFLLCSCSSKKQASDNLDQFSPSLNAPSQSTTATTVPTASEGIVVEGDLVDLSEMSSTMVFAELYNVSMYPDAYAGKTLKMRGQFTSIYIEEEDTRYYACYVMDETGCCMQGFEFVSDDLTFPDDYPEEGAYFTVTGTITLYEKDGQLYRHLTDATIELE